MVQWISSTRGATQSSGRVHLIVETLYSHAGGANEEGGHQRMNYACHTRTNHRTSEVHGATLMLPVGFLERPRMIQEHFASTPGALLQAFMRSSRSGTDPAREATLPKVTLR